MADTQGIKAKVSERQPLLLVTDDASLEHLIALEAHELSLPMLTVRELSGGNPSGESRAVVLDLDSLGGMQALLHGDADGVIGICRQASMLPDMLLARVSYVLERPFATDELRALLRQLCYGGEPSVVRRSPAREQHHTPMAMMLLDGGILRCGEHSIALTPKEAALMKCLLAHRAQTVSREQLCECLKHPDRPSNQDSNKTEVYLCRLRRKLEAPTGRKLLITVRGVGYRLE